MGQLSLPQVLQPPPVKMVVVVAGPQEVRSPLAQRLFLVLAARLWAVLSLVITLQNTASMPRLMQLGRGLLMLQRQQQTLQWMPESSLWMQQKTSASLSWTSFDKLSYVN